MKFISPLIVVSDMERSKLFYSKVLGLDVELDFGENVTLTGGIVLQTKDSWPTLIHKSKIEIFFGANNSELYFEENDFDNFILKLKQIPNISYVHPVIEHSWGQRVVRFYDPDKHIIEVAENLTKVVQKFLNEGMSAETIAMRMDVTVDYVKSCL